MSIADFAERQIIQPVDIDFRNLANGMTVQQSTPGTILFWRLPSQFLGNKVFFELQSCILNSYGLPYTLAKFVWRTYKIYDQILRVWARGT